MNVQFIAGIFTVVCIVTALKIICNALDELKKGVGPKHIYASITPQQVEVMKEVFPNFDWVRIDREIANAQKDKVYEPSHVDSDGIIECIPHPVKRIDKQI